MMTITRIDAPKITEYLDLQCTVQKAEGCAPGTGLAAVHRQAYDYGGNVTKAEAVKGLTKFYAAEENIVDIWNGLSECERDFVGYVVRYRGVEYVPTTIEYARKYDFALETTNRWGNKENVLDNYACKHLKFLHLLKMYVPGTKAFMLFPSGKDMPFFVLNVLEKVIDPLKYEYAEYTPSKKDFIICREHRLGDFGALVRLSASERIKVKPFTFEATKAKLAKMSEAIGFEEVCDLEGKFCSPKEAKKGNDIKVALPLFVLAANSGLLNIDREGNVSPDKRSPELLSLPSPELAKKLFEDYCRENRIFEYNYIAGIATREYNHHLWWHKVRKSLIDLLRTCPIGEFIAFEAFDRYAKIFHGNSFRGLGSYTAVIKGNDYDYERYSRYSGFGRGEPDWDEYEAQIIRVILSFLSALGMIDIAYTENVPRIKFSRGDSCVGISGFRMTSLGAWILGLTETYEAGSGVGSQNEEGSFLVLPDYSVIISGLKCRIEHETYFSRFLTKACVNDNAAVYKIDFQSVIRAHDGGIMSKKIKQYLQSASGKPLPDNVARSLDDWQAKVGRIRMRTLTVLETDDALLLEELKHIKGMGEMVVAELPHAVAIDDARQKKAKALIEKNGWLVKCD